MSLLGWQVVKSQALLVPLPQDEEIHGVAAVVSFSVSRDHAQIDYSPPPLSSHAAPPGGAKAAAPDWR